MGCTDNTPQSTKHSPNPGIRSSFQRCLRRAKFAHEERERLHADVHGKAGSQIIARRSLILPFLLSAAILVGAIFSRAPLRDAVSRATPQGVELVVSPAYLLLSPLSRALDTIGLLSIGQHIALGATVIGLAILLAAAPGAGPLRRRVTRAIASGAISLVALALLYACAAALPRPMAALAVTDPNVVRVDFHSHTNASGDARSRFSPEENRAWHQRGGFDVAYISDHRSFAGAESARVRNPARAGDGTVLLSAYEGRYLGTFEIFLSLSRIDSARLLNRRRWLVEGRLSSGRLPTSVVALPSPLVDVQPIAHDGAPYIGAIEISDGSPKGFAQSDRDHAVIIRRADSLGIALVSGSNNHGWGSVIPAWTLVNVPSWRGISADSIGAAIEGALRAEPRTVTVVERLRPTLSSPAAMALTFPVAAAQLFATLTTPERLVWLAWIWGLAGVVLVWARMRRDRVH